MLCSKDKRARSVHSSPQVWLFGTEMELQPDLCVQVLGGKGDHRVDPGPLSQWQDLQKSSRWHLGALGGCWLHSCASKASKSAGVYVCV